MAVTLLDRLAPWLLALWWSSLTLLGAVVVPMLFAYLPSKALAGQMAAHLFGAQFWVSCACGVGAMLALRAQARTPLSALGLVPSLPSRLNVLRVAVWLGLLLAFLQEWAVAPHIVARDNLRLWHSVGTLMFVAQWACACWLFARWPQPAAVPMKA